MRGSESIINNLLEEVDSLTFRIRNINQCLMRTFNTGLIKRLFKENELIFLRLNEILKISKILNKNNPDKITLSSLLEEKCKRSLHEATTERNLFFL